MLSIIAIRSDTWSVLGNPLVSDHFPEVTSYASPIACATLRQQRWKFDQADWEIFKTQADITEDMVRSGSMDEVVSLVSCILSAANNAISQPSSRLPRFPKPWWNEECQMAKKDQYKAWNRFRRYPTAYNMIAFNKARARAWKIHRQRKRESWIKYESNIHMFNLKNLIKVVNEFKFLGLIFDQSLRFHRHLKDLKIRSAKALNILKILANTRWRADRRFLLRLYRALIRSKLDYESVVYSSACKSLLKILDPVHHQALRLCLYALPTSASNYTAELHALRIALEHISLSCGKNFIIYTDFLSALQSILSSHSSHPILVDITYALANHLKKKDIRFCWIPGHTGITGNELADTDARSATCSSERFPIPH
ncbi:RNase H domain-containing protein [Trichonephila inaurata madagascariensis]|uniref:RNase H domain-containing protein n=1 Tax=Trichonephila inaurata madagascariensis TaxID=2747483 RepID=A0A8X6I6A5_9ARAC|nr:RNase H domain-containing protein [Trichonephila inaurata madagascariensis]